MYEPIFSPQFDGSTVSLDRMRFSIVYCNEHIDPENNPNADPLHMHKQLEIFFNFDSDASFLVNNHLYKTIPGSAVVSKGNDLHVCIFNKAQRHAYACLWIDADYGGELFGFLENEDFCPLYSFDELTAGNLKRCLCTLDHLCKNSGSRLEQTALLLEILAIFEKAEYNAPETTKLPPVFQAVLDDIRHNFVSINHVSDILTKHYISQATLNRYFRKYIHTTPHEYLDSQKLSYAAKLLSEGKTVTESCIQSGFSDCSRFIVLFKRKFFLTPMQYKKSLSQIREE